MALVVLFFEIVVKPTLSRLFLGALWKLLLLPLRQLVLLNRSVVPLGLQSKLIVLLVSMFLNMDGTTLPVGRCSLLKRIVVINLPLSVHVTVRCNVVLVTPESRPRSPLLVLILWDFNPNLTQAAVNLLSFSKATPLKLPQALQESAGTTVMLQPFVLTLDITAVEFIILMRTRLNPGPFP